LGGIPTPPELAADDGNIMYRNTTLSGAMDFAIVYGGSITMNGSQDARQAVESLRKKIPGDFIWFIHGGNAYVIRDLATVQSARQLYSQMDGLGKQMEELGQQQDALGKQMDFLGKQMEAVRVQVPADLAQRLKEVEEKLNALGGTADMDQLGKLQEELGDLQGKLGDLQGKAGNFQGELGRKQGAIGEKQGELGRRQGELGSKQADIESNAARQMQDIINKALASGAAKRVE
jgi:chromosome segregation ATPase